MAKMTFRQALITTEWTPIAAGSSYSSFGIMCNSGSALIFIGDTEPEIDEEDVLPISASDTRELATVIPASMTLYARAKGDDTSVNGFRVPV